MLKGVEEDKQKDTVRVIDDAMKAAVQAGKSQTEALADTEIAVVGQQQRNFPPKPTLTPQGEGAKIAAMRSAVPKLNDDYKTEAVLDAIDNAAREDKMDAAKEEVSNQGMMAITDDEAELIVSMRVAMDLGAPAAKAQQLVTNLKSVVTRADAYRLIKGLVPELFFDQIEENTRQVVKL